MSGAKDARKPEQVLADIHAKIATIDGISTIDAMQLGALIREYGQSSAGEIIGPLFESILGGLTKPTKPRPPWEPEG